MVGEDVVVVAVSACLLRRFRLIRTQARMTANIKTKPPPTAPPMIAPSGGMLVVDTGLLLDDAAVGWAVDDEVILDDTELDDGVNMLSPSAGEEFKKAAARSA